MNRYTIGLIVICAVAIVQALFWVVYLQLLRRQANRMRAMTRETGETLVIRPERAYYQGWTRRFGLAKWMVAVALTETRFLFARAVGPIIDIPVDEITAVSDTAHLGRLAHRSGHYLALTLRDGTEVVFTVRDQQEWIEAIRQLGG